MRFIKTLLLITILGGGTVFAGYATFKGFGVQTAMYPKGISIRDTSVQGSRPGVVPFGRGPRVHRGGGLSRGKWFI